MTTGGSTVLVVDDDVNIRETVQASLAGEGYRVLTASNGQAALDVLHKTSVDLILLDMNMPVMDGWTFARNYHHQQPPRAPVVAFTAAHDAVQAAAAIGAADHLNKPFELADLLSTVEHNRYSVHPPTVELLGPGDITRSDVVDRQSGQRWLEPFDVLPQPDNHRLSLRPDIVDAIPTPVGESFLAALVSSSNDAIIGKTLDGTVRIWNTASELLYGYTAAEMIGQTIARLVPSDRAGELPAILDRLRRGERIQPFETVRLRRDGWRLDVRVTISPVIDATGRIVGAATIARDITAGKQLTAQLQALADISRTLDNAHPNPEAALDSITKYVSQVLGDGAVLRLAKDSALELVGVHHRNVFAQVVLLRSLEQAVVVGRGVEGTVASSNLPLRIQQLVPEDGRSATALGTELRDYVDLVGVASLLVVPAWVRGRSIGTLMVLRDRPGRPYSEADQAFAQTLADHLAVAVDNARLFAGERQARADAQHAVGQLEQSVGLRDQVLLTVSHDMKNPLTAIMGQGQMLDLNAARSGALEDSPLRRGLKRITDAARAVNGDLEELVDASRQQIGEPLVLLQESTDLVALAEQVVETWRVSTPERRFEFATREIELVGMWDRRRLARVLDNLLGNAAKYSRAGSLVSIRLRSAQSEAGRVAVMEVQDEGIGIPAADLPHVFEWFRRGMNVAHIGGTGIGPASAAGVIAEHGGTLRVESQPGHGSTFVLELPLSARSVDPPVKPHLSADDQEDEPDEISSEAA